jgi:surface polysaccharide O-acyltransferase-like enzyme
MSISIIARINVPLFFMISGALLLPKNESYKKVFQKRIVRFIILLFGWMFIFYLAHKLRAVYLGEPYEFKISTYLYGTLNRSLDDTIPYWYFYSYLGFLCMLPFLQRMAKGMSKTDFYVLLGFHFLFTSFLPVINLIFQYFNLPQISIYSDFSIPLATTRSIFYPLIGYYLDQKVDMKEWKESKILRLIMLMIVTVFSTIIVIYIDKCINGAYSTNFIQLFDYMLAIYSFLLIKYFFEIKNTEIFSEKQINYICMAGSLTLGIYILDPLFKIFIYPYYESLLFPTFPVILISFLWVIISMFLGGFTTYLLKKIPVIKKLI